ncbi:conjugal transfer relaxosome component TraJ [Serratia quinivorans]|uniref:plasmid mobilization protein n=1 Tax=Serratia quinivorans TaxID=137545 RepID=UPI00217906D1|nr:CopG family transcriptional regulator [Serratia quinivorans]CAI2145031.1 conjugal transfer relaxosome component TraJ [Serratia quinivorans]
MSKQSDTQKEGLNRDRKLRFRVNAVEEAAIESRSRNAGLSLSALLRAGALHHPIRSVVDLKAVADLGKINGDLGRVAGLLKLWLSEKNGKGASCSIEVERMMVEFRELQAGIREKMSAVVFARKHEW